MKQQPHVLPALRVVQMRSEACVGIKSTGRPWYYEDNLEVFCCQDFSDADVNFLVKIH